MSEAIRSQTWPLLADARKAAFKAIFDRHQAAPEWVRRYEAARPEVEQLEGMLVQRRLDQALSEATDYVESLLRQHSQGEHRDSVSGPHYECPGCEILLAPEVLVREHRGW